MINTPLPIFFVVVVRNIKPFNMENVGVENGFNVVLGVSLKIYATSTYTYTHIKDY